MRIVALAGEFELPSELSLEITAYNQIFNDEGEQSVPVTLPGTHHNLSLLNFPNRLDNYYKPLSELQVDLIDDVFLRPARMVIHSANEGDGISCTLYLSEASFYALIDDKTMEDVQLDVINGQGTTLDDKVNYLITMLKNEYLNQNSNMYSVFPVQTGQSITRNWSYTTGSGNQTYTETFNLVLNGFETAYSYPFNNDVDKIVMLDRFMGENEQNIVVDGTNVHLTKGYGMTAFVNVFYFLQKMFNGLGYTFDDSRLRSSFCGANGRIVFLNNVADAIYDGKLDLNQLVPAIGLKDFLKKMASYFAGVWFMDEVNKRATFYLYSDLFQPGAVDDLTNYMSSAMKIETVDFTNMDLCDTNNTTFKQRQNYSYVEVSFVPESSYTMTVHYVSAGMIATRDFLLKLLTINNIVHRNSTLVKNTEIDTTKETDSGNELLLAGVRKGVLEQYRREYDMLLEIIEYYRGYSSIYFNSNDPVSYLKNYYLAYFDWNKNSNLQVSCDMHLTPAVLYSIDLSKQHLLDGQIYFIDKINYKLPYDGKQTLSLRTFRGYNDR